MLNQTFTAQNFRKIFDLQNRKGKYLEGEFFPEIEDITVQLKDVSSEFRVLKKAKSALTEAAYEERRAQLDDRKKSLQEQKESLLSDALERVAQEVSESNFKIKIQKVTTAGAKDLYVTQKDAASFFAIKQLSINFNKLFKVKQSNRYNVLCQLRSVLDDKFPKYIIRTDIASFYESICRKTLVEIIDEASLLTLSSKRMVRQILKSYEEISGAAVGLPRGIGISAYLAELYMRDFDRTMREHPDVIFYARYVDDIAVVFAHNPQKKIDDFSDFITQKLADKKLSLNLAKTTKICSLSTPNYNFDYLGYRFSYTKGIVISITQSKIDRIKNKVNACFQQFEKDIGKGRKNNKRAVQNQLIRRIKFLTGNTRLLNNKQNALIGIYFSNSLVTDAKNITELDLTLSKKVSALTNANLQAQLKQYSFVKGFENRTFYTFTTAEFSQIVRAWKNVA